MKDKLNNKNIMISVIVLLLILGIGFSYAWWRYTVIQDKTNVGVSKCFSIEFANQANEINLTNMYPISDEEGKKLTPFTFTLKNTCSMSTKYTLSMEMLSGTTLNSNYLAILVNNGNIKLLSSFDESKTVIDGSTESRILDTGVLQANGSKDYSISIWMDKDVTLADDAQNKVFKSKVVVDASAVETVMEKIIASVDTTGKCPTVNVDGSITKSDGESESGYLCSAPDNYGTSYYYRGTVENNYVYFAGKYWRIVRINGDGSMRIIYDGTSAHANGESSSDRRIGTTAFNLGNSNNAYVGYMYGNSDGVMEDSGQYSTSNFVNTDTYYISKEYAFDENTKKFSLKNPVAVLGSDLTSDYVGYYTSLNTSTPSTYYMLYKITSITDEETQANVGYVRVYYGTTTKEQAQTNANDSTIKKYLDDWYEKNIKSTEYEQYLADNIFCNDRSVISGTGAGMNVTDYRWSNRYDEIVILACLKKNDAFTVNDTSKGNGSLKYPIGLLTADEFWLAGGSASKNPKFYLYTGKNEWLLSPRDFNGNYASGLGQTYVGSYGRYNVNHDNGVRAVLNLKPGLMLQGTGTRDDPYHLSGI